MAIQNKHTHSIDKLKIDEMGDYLYWKCACGMVFGENIESSEELVELCKLAYK